MRGPDLVIDEKALYEMHNYALRCPLKLGNYSYRETQQILTIYSLLKWIESYGLSSQVSLNLMEEKYNVGQRTED